MHDIKKFIKFCVVGIVNTSITFCIFYLLSETMGINYLVSSLLGYIAGVICSFSFNKRWTFNNKDNKAILQFGKFIILNLLSLGINLLILYICVKVFFISKVISQIVATGFTTAFNFLGSKVFVFAGTKEVSIEDSTMNIPTDLQKTE